MRPARTSFGTERPVRFARTSDGSPTGRDMLACALDRGGQERREWGPTQRAQELIKVAVRDDKAVLALSDQQIWRVRYAGNLGGLALRALGFYVGDGGVLVHDAARASVSGQF